jgi:hypothetical protein
VETFVRSFVDLFDPLDSVKPKDTLKLGMAHRDAIGALHEINPLRHKMVQDFTRKMFLKAGTESMTRYNQDKYWDLFKQKTMDVLMGAVGLTGWKANLAANCVALYRQDAQQHLDRAAQAWETGAIPFTSGRIGPLMRPIYAELEAKLRENATRQMTVEIWEASVKLAFDSVGKGIKYGAASFSGPAGYAATKQAVDNIEKGFNAVNTLLEGYTLYEWMVGVSSGYVAGAQFADTALGGLAMNTTARSYCFGDGCP